MATGPLILNGFDIDLPEEIDFVVRRFPSGDEVKAEHERLGDFWFVHWFGGELYAIRLKPGGPNLDGERRRLEQTLFTLDWIEDPDLRRDNGRELNEGGTRNSLARAVFIHRLGEIRDRTYENQQQRASGLNLLVTAIILWNTRYLGRPVAALRGTEDAPDELLKHLPPLAWEHVNLTGDYISAAADEADARGDRNSGVRPPRSALTANLLVA